MSMLAALLLLFLPQAPLALRVQEPQPKCGHGDIGCDNVRAAENVSQLVDCTPIEEWYVREKANNWSSQFTFTKSYWRQRFFDLLGKGLEDPCNADVQFCFITSGFGSKMTTIIGDVMTAVYANRSFTVCDKPFWSEYFKLNFGDANDTRNKCPHVNKCRMGVVPEPQQRFTGLNPQYLFDFHRSISRMMYFSHNDQTRNAIKSEIAKMDFRKEVPYIGVHIRHGDKYKEATLVPTQDYAKVVKQHALKNNISHVYIATDDVGAMGVFKKEMGRKYIVTSMSSRYNDTVPRPFRSQPHGDGLVGLFVDLDLLVNANVFIGSGFSNIGRLVYSLRDFNKPSIDVRISKSNKQLHANPFPMRF